MFCKRLMNPAVLAFSLAVALLGLFGRGRAAPEVVVGNAFTYQGRLILSGSPVNDLCDFQFSLWNSAVAGAQVGGTANWYSVTVSDGLFSLPVDFGGGMFTGDARWLAISVRCPAGGGSYTSLIPRQPLTAAPYALFSLDTAEHDHWGETWAGAIGGAGLRLENTAGSGLAIGLYGRSASTEGYGVHGQATATSGIAYGVLGESASTSGRGVYGLATASSGSAFGMHGESASTSGRGVYGYASASTGTTYGVAGQAASSAGAGVQGLASSVTGATTGVWGLSNSSSGTGVLGTASSTTGTTYGVYGQSSSDQGFGLAGVNWSNTGATYGVFGRSLSPNGYAGYFSGVGANAVVVANTGNGRGIYVETSADTAIWALTDAGIGIDSRTSSTTGRGVYGYATATTGDSQGVYGRTLSSEGRGVYGWASATSGANYGVYGRTSSAAGYAGYFQGNLHTTGTLTKAGGAFKIDHPLDPANKYLYHSFVESPDMKNIYDGVVVLDAEGAATVTLPAWFEALNGDFRYQLTPFGAAMPNLHVAQKIQANTFRIAGGAPGMEVSWQVTGIRHDAYANAHRIPVEELKPAAERGLYLHPAEMSQPLDKGLDYQVNAAAQQTESE